LLRSDALEKNLEPIIDAEIAELGLKIVDRKTIQLTPRLVRKHYAHLKDEPFFLCISAYMRRRPCITIIVRGSDAVAMIRIAEVTDPTLAASYT
jgi:nucleoside-diphosphate kinase